MFKIYSINKTLDLTMKHNFISTPHHTHFDQFAIAGLGQTD